MTDDRQIPPPEDDNIPDWLRDHPLAEDDAQPEAGAGQPEADEQSLDEEFLAFGEPEEDDPLAFLRDVGGAPTPGVRDTQSMQPADAGAGDPRKPLIDGDEAELRGMTGQLPWLSSLGDEPAAAPPDAPGSESLRGLTGHLPWMGDEQPPADAAEPVEDAAAPESADAPEPAETGVPEMPEWLGLAGALAGEQAAIPDDDEDEIPPWVGTGELAEEEPEAEAPSEAEEALPDWVTAAAEMVPALEDEAEFPPEAEAEPDSPDWLGTDTADLVAASPEEDVSYEEWMRQQDEDAYQPSAEELLAAEVPDWFGEIEGAETPAEPAAPGQAAEFVPDWYFGLEDEAAEEKPDWLDETAFSMDALTAEPVLPQELAVPPEPVVPPEPALPAEDIEADWLDSLEAELEGPTLVERPAGAPGIAEPTISDEGFVDWLEDFEPEDEMFSPVDAPAPEALEPGDVPDWLAGLEPEDDAELPPDISQPVTTDNVLSGTDEDFMAVIDGELGEQDVLETLGVTGALPALLPDDAAVDFEALLKEAALPPEDLDKLGDLLPETDLETSEMPAWLSEAQVGGFSAARAALGGEETPLDELSERLRALRERTGKAARIEPPPPSGTAAADPLLKDVTGQLPPAVAFDVSGGREVVLDVALDEAQQTRVDTLAALLGLEDEAEREGEADPVAEARRIRDAATRARARMRFKPARLVVTLVLAVALVLPFFVDLSEFFVLPGAGLTSGEHGALDGAIEALQPGARVLVGFEYGPTAAGELDELTNALMTHLLVRGVQPVLISTNPAGVLHARNVMARLADDTFILGRLGRADEPLTMPDDYVILPYLPGGIVGLRSLTATSTDVNALDRGLFVVDVAGNPTGLNVQLLQTTFDLVLVIGERGEDVRQWVEQVGTTVRIPMAAAVSVSAEPVARPYLQSGQLIGLLAGYRDAYKYNGVLEALLGGVPLPAPTDSPAAEDAEVEPTAEPTAEPTEIPPTPTEEIALAAADLTATADADATAEATSAVTPSPTPRSFVTATPAPEFTPVPTTTGGRSGEMVNVPLPERPELETRWYSISLGAFAAAALISAGALLNILRWLLRRREP